MLLLSSLWCQMGWCPSEREPGCSLCFVPTSAAVFLWEVPGACRFPSSMMSCLPLLSWQPSGPCFRSPRPICSLLWSSSPCPLTHALHFLPSAGSQRLRRSEWENQTQSWRQWWSWNCVEDCFAVFGLDVLLWTKQWCLWTSWFGVMKHSCKSGGEELRVVNKSTGFLYSTAVTVYLKL